MLAGSDTPGMEPARRAAAQYGQRQALSAHYAERLRAEVPMPMTLVPHRPAEVFGRRSIEAIAEVIGADA